MADLYADWETIQSRSYTFEDRHPGDIAHVHPVNKVVMKRPSTKVPDRKLDSAG
jgi:hypothetical protein